MSSDLSEDVGPGFVPELLPWLERALVGVAVQRTGDPFEPNPYEVEVHNGTPAAKGGEGSVIARCATEVEAQLVAAALWTLLDRRSSATPATGTPEDGHRFRIGVISAGSSKVVGDAHHKDAPEFMGPELAVEVRGWSLREALTNAIDLPLSAWMPEERAHEHE